MGAAGEEQAERRASERVQGDLCVLANKVSKASSKMARQTAMKADQLQERLPVEEGCAEVINRRTRKRFALNLASDLLSGTCTKSLFFEKFGLQKVNFGSSLSCGNQSDLPRGVN